MHRSLRWWCFRASLSLHSSDATKRSVYPPKQGAVYVKYGDVSSAVTAFGKLNGRWFDGQMIVAEYVPVSVYAERFPNA